MKIKSLTKMYLNLERKKETSKKSTGNFKRKPTNTQSRMMSARQLCCWELQWGLQLHMGERPGSDGALRSTLRSTRRSVLLRGL